MVFAHFETHAGKIPLPVPHSRSEVASSELIVRTLGTEITSKIFFCLVWFRKSNLIELHLQKYCSCWVVFTQRSRKLQFCKACMGNIVQWPKGKQKMGSFPSDLPRLDFQVYVYVFFIENAKKYCYSWAHSSVWSAKHPSNAYNKQVTMSVPLDWGVLNLPVFKFCVIDIEQNIFFSLRCYQMIQRTIW